MALYLNKTASYSCSLKVFQTLPLVLTAATTVVIPLQGRPVCAAVMRAFGAQLAEVPLVATKADARRQGHCRVLMQAFEVILKKASPHHLVSTTAMPTADQSLLKYWFIAMKVACELLLG